MTTKLNKTSTSPELAVCINNFNQSLCRDRKTEIVHEVYNLGFPEIAEALSDSIYGQTVNLKFILGEYEVSDKNNYAKPKPKNSLWKFILAFFIALFIGVSVNAQKFEKDDLAHIEAGAAIHSATYFGVYALNWEDKWKYILPAITVNVVGATKEIIDSQEPNDRFDMKDMMFNNVGMLISMGLIEGMKAIGVPENIAVSSVLTVSAFSLGLTVNF